MCESIVYSNTCVGRLLLQPSKSGRSREVVAYNRLHTKSDRQNAECIYACVYSMNQQAGKHYTGIPY